MITLEFLFLFYWVVKWSVSESWETDSFRVHVDGVRNLNLIIWTYRGTLNGLFSKIFWLRKEKKNNYPLYKISCAYLRLLKKKKKKGIVIRNQSGTSFYYLLLFLTFRISRGFGIGSELPRFFRIKTFNIPHITIITFFPIIF